MANGVNTAKYKFLQVDMNTTYSQWGLAHIGLDLPQIQAER